MIAQTRAPAPRRGISLLETMVALTILATALLGMAEYGRRFAKTNGNAMTTNSALDLATERIERVKAERNYVTIDTLAGTRTIPVTVNGVTLSYSQVTQIVQTINAFVNYKTVTVTVTRATMAKPVKKTTAISRF